MNFKEQLACYQEIVNKELDRYISNDECPEKLLNEAVNYSLISGGKRLRPILILSSYLLFKEDFEICFPFMAAMEMIHNFSLIHDDLPGIDNDELRHGKPTTHKAYGEATAILAGDLLFNNAYKTAILSLKDGKNIDDKIRALNELSASTEKMIKGEYVDTYCEGKEIPEKILNYIHDNKTGALITGSIRIGAILAKASDEELSYLTKYGEKIGLAFQIKDDILSEIGDEKIFGKPIGNDKERGKCTFVTMFGLEESKRILDETINDAIEIINRFGGKGEFLKELAIYIKDRVK